MNLFFFTYFQKNQINIFDKFKIKFYTVLSMLSINHIKFPKWDYPINLSNINLKILKLIKFNL